MVGAIRTVTVGVSSIERSLALFRDVLGLRIDWQHEADPDLARAWGLPETTRVRLAELSCAGYPTGRLRLAEYDPAAREVVRADLPGEPDAPTAIGPKAIDFYTEDIESAVAQLRAAGYPPRSRPIHYTVGDIETTELLVTGPDGMPFLVMQGPHPPTSQRTGGPRCAYSEIPTVSVICADLEASRRFYEDVLGLEAGTDAEIADDLRDIVCELTGVPRGTRIYLRVYREPGEPSGKYLLVHFYDASATRLEGRMQPGRLGISLYGHEVDDVDAVVGRLAGSGGEAVGGPAEADLGPGGRRRIQLVRGPNEELLELSQPA